ncbi:MAG: TRAP transporter fused permease subunit, partial [Lawsonibacter sp.]|nr:TRAP transporter fused permease subunit [Lawsonibacter sp.]
PPIMGAAAFIMTEYIGCSYGTIALAACVPALLYFTGIFTNVHFEALKHGLLGIPKDQRPVVRDLLKRGWYMILPIVVIVVLLVRGRSAMTAAIWGIFSCLAVWIVEIIRQTHKFDIIQFAKMFIVGLEQSARSAISVAVTCGCAGIIVGVVTMTGLGLKMANGIVALAGGSLYLTMIMTMLCSIVLGMGVPTTANYIIQATISAPALVALGVPALAAHLFVFYFGIVADITPPVALAAFAGSGIAGSDPMKTGVNATRLGIAAYLVPYMFVMNPVLVLINVHNDPTWIFVLLVLKAIGTAVIGMMGIATGFTGYFRTTCKLWERPLLVISGLLLVDAGTVTDVVGIGLFVLVFAIQSARTKKVAVA